MDIEVLGKTMWLHGIRGTVRGLNQWTQTTTQTTSGSAVHTGGGHYVINAPQVNTNTTRHQTFWVVAPSGREHQVSGNYPLRDGHEVSVVWGGLKGASASGHFICQNLTTGNGWKSTAGLPGTISLHGMRKLTLQYVLLIILCLTIGGISGSVNHSSKLSAYATAGFDVLIVAGFFHLLVLIQRNRQTALATIERAVRDNPAFTQSLSA
ncbi:hypothetical protein AA101099_2922 [Neoasaia chiangmaiensis NBRC 101099]|uniref:Uncharacterized protein n=2 Tax=Neoasaia chiangmaiensis TaxID=320497 RepID=A0A1U9KP55_9PROT|nr:hypothetical protein [Neoasaia chiangmaiensis]AQS87470.1 hypothetical protein A0U93_05420 [Neoasaia chiangmaiensis]GBR42596.1 hypothetical protein AA101099_2922 [Neoasaia chiangmaiensis NBRC 101099]GEN16258.1 hypothetical protein NCH01_26890 [Neoasaia chiangmaiensis]